MPVDSLSLQVGQIAKHCQVNPRTVHRWIQSGQLKSFAIPSGHYRIKRNEFREFLIANNMPLQSEAQNFQPDEMLILDNDDLRLQDLKKLFSDKAPDLKVYYCQSMVEGALCAAVKKPKFICLSLNFSEEQLKSFVGTLRSFDSFKNIQLFGLCDKGDSLPRRNVLRKLEAVLECPFSNKEFARIFQRYFKELVS